jgi:hypothetical protein
LRADEGSAVVKLCLWLVLLVSCAAFAAAMWQRRWRSAEDHFREMSKPCEFFVNVVQPQLPKWREEFERDMRETLRSATSQPAVLSARADGDPGV